MATFHMLNTHMTKKRSSVELQWEAIFYDNVVIVRHWLQVTYVYKKRSSAELQWEAIFAMPRMATFHAHCMFVCIRWRHFIQHNDVQ